NGCESTWYSSLNPIYRDPTAARGRTYMITRSLGLALLFAFVLTTAATPRARNAGSIIPISQSLCEEMKVHKVLNPRAPVGCERLKLIKFSYVDFGGQLLDDGEIVVMDAAAKHVLNIFNTLRKIRFPIAKARLMNHYEGNDEASMADN